MKSPPNPHKKKEPTLQLTLPLLAYLQTIDTLANRTLGNSLPHTHAPQLLQRLRHKHNRINEHNHSQHRTRQKQIDIAVELDDKAARARHAQARHRAEVVEQRDAVGAVRGGTQIGDEAVEGQVEDALV